MGPSFKAGPTAKPVILILALLFLVCPPALAGDILLRISTSYDSPLSTPSQSGMLDRIIKEACCRVDVGCEIVHTSTERSLVVVNQGLLDGEINRIEGMENSFPNLVRVPEPNMRMHFVAFATRDIPISGWDSIRKLRVGLVSGWKILERNTEGFPRLTKLTKIGNLFRMLELGRLDVVLYSKLSGYEQIRNLGYRDIRHLSPPLCSKDMFLYLHKNHAELAVPLAAALREMKRDGTWDAIVKETRGSPHRDLPRPLPGL
ncbi:MAG: transporter substrate-binding domain-containing protein [Desulfovibrionaceae bacterium]|nr:transporter substrate-binding domain-containing protein [Desulfovibrionaceae bacterium]